MPTTYGNDIVYCLKSHCGVRGYCRQKWVLQVQIICKFSNERTCKRNKDVQGLSCGFEVYVKYIHKTSFFTFETMIFYSLKGDLLPCKRSPFTKQKVMFYFRIYIVLTFKYL